MIFAYFHLKGTALTCSNMVNTCSSGILICSTVFFRVFGEIQSASGDLHSFRVLILPAPVNGDQN